MSAPRIVRDDATAARNSASLQVTGLPDGITMPRAAARCLMARQFLVPSARMTSARHRAEAAAVRNCSSDQARRPMRAVLRFVWERRAGDSNPEDLSVG